MKELIYSNNCNVLKHPDGDITFRALGGSSEVGATSYFINWKGQKILIDAGKRKFGIIDKPEYDEIDKEIDYFFITHIHQDHIGSLMDYASFFNLKNIYATQQTKDCLLPVFLDSRKILFQSGDYHDLEAYIDVPVSQINPNSNIKTMSTEKINHFISRIKVIPYNVENIVDGFKFRFIETSHLIGSCGIVFEDYSYRLFITSDYTESEKFFHPATNFSYLFANPVDTLITESTYGLKNTLLVTKERTLCDLEVYVNKIFNDGGNVMIPAFSIGRSQELILALLKLKNQNRIPFTTEISLLGGEKSLGNIFTERYYNLYYQFLYDELGEDPGISYILFKKKYLGRISDQDTNRFFTQKNQILIGQPGMLGAHQKDKKFKNDQDELFGSIYVSLAALESNNFGIIFIGYQAPGTLGHSIQNIPFGNSFQYKGINYKRSTPHIYNVTFPGHVSSLGLIDTIEKINPSNVIMTHGELNSSRGLIKVIRKNNINILIPEIEENIYLMDQNKKVFFSSHHKTCNIIVDPLFDHSGLKASDYTKSENFKNHRIHKVIDSISKFDAKTNHVVLLLNEENYQPELINFLLNSIKNKGFSSDCIRLKDSLTPLQKLNSLIEFISEIALDYREKFRLYFLSNDFYMTSFLNLFAQLLNEESFYVGEKIIPLPALPIDIQLFQNEKYIDLLKNGDSNGLYTDHINNQYFLSDFYEIIDRIHYFKTGKNKKNPTIAESIPNQLPKYEKDSIFFRKDVFGLKSNSLWGNIENIYDIKNYKAIEILSFISNQLNESILKIDFTNFRSHYNHHKYYGEIVTSCKNQIFYKLVLENGTQYLTISLIPTADIEQCKKRIGLKKE